MAALGATSSGCIGCRGGLKGEPGRALCAGAAGGSRRGETEAGGAAYGGQGVTRAVWGFSGAGGTQRGLRGEVSHL